MIDRPVYTPSLQYYFSISGATVWEDDGMCDCILKESSNAYSKQFITKS